MAKAEQPAAPGTLLVAAWLFLVCLLLLRPIEDLDLFWQLRMGQLILEQGHLVTVEPFSYLRPGQPAPPVGWLSMVIYAVLDRLGSWTAIQAGHVLVFAGAFAVAGWTARRDVPRPMVLLAAVFLGFVVSLPHSTVRAQGFALGSFALLMALATSQLSLRVKLLLAVPLLVFWQNAHPSVLTAAFWLGPLAAAAWWRWRRQGEPAPWGLTLLLVLVALAQLVTPMGWDAFEVQRRNLEISRDTLHVSEWMPSWDAAVRAAQQHFWLTLALAVLLLVRLRFRVRLEDLGVFLLFTGVTLWSARFGLFWALVMVPVLARWIDAAFPLHVFPRDEGVTRRMFAWWGPGMIGVELVVILVLLARGPVIAEMIPVRGVAALKEVLPAGRIYNYYAWSGPLILAGHPDWQTGIDTRLYLYDAATWYRYEAVAKGQVPLAEVVAQDRPDAFFLRPSYDGPFVELLNTSADWRRVYEDANCVVFVKRH